jgi:hypothetical protein
MARSMVPGMQRRTSSVFPKTIRFKILWLGLPMRGGSSSSCTHPKTDTVVRVGHDSVNRALLLQLLDQPLSAYWRLAQAPGTLNEIDIVDRRVRVLRITKRGI